MMTNTLNNDDLYGPLPPQQEIPDSESNGEVLTTTADEYKTG